jgi:hypothetical protein
MLVDSALSQILPKLACLNNESVYDDEIPRSIRSCPSKLSHWNRFFMCTKNFVFASNFELDEDYSLGSTFCKVYSPASFEFDSYICLLFNGQETEIGLITDSSCSAIEYLQEQSINNFPSKRYCERFPIAFSSHMMLDKNGVYAVVDLYSKVALKAFPDSGAELCLKYSENEQKK